MQIKALHKNIYTLYRYTSTQEKLEIHRKKYEKTVSIWRKLKSETVCDALCAEITGISRSTYFRYEKILKNLENFILPPSKRPKVFRKPLWGESEMQLVLSIRRENPTYGKNKIAIILKRDFSLSLSESTVGRILKHLSLKGLVPKSISAPKQRRKRRFKGHAKPWQYSHKPLGIGHMVQIDHMTVSKSSLPFKHFKAWDPLSKYIYANVYTNAKSSSAKRFLLELVEQSPFKIHSIQVDGGSEFMKEFEETCQQLGIELYVLPPKRPQYNGGVERVNRIFREELYSNPKIFVDSIGAMRFELSKALNKYNTFRPHFSLKGLTPMQYIRDHHPIAS